MNPFNLLLISYSIPLAYVEYYKKIVPVVFVAVPLAAYIGIETERADEGNWEQKYVVYPYTHCRWKVSSCTAINMILVLGSVLKKGKL